MMLDSLYDKKIMNKPNIKDIILNLFSVSAFLFLLIYFVFIHNSYDSRAYEDVFNNCFISFDAAVKVSKSSGIDFGFVCLTKLISIFACNYTTFRLFIFLIASLILYISTKKINKFNKFVFVLYILFPFVYDSYQIEFFLAYSFIVYGLTSMITNDSKWLIKVILSFIIAIFIHNNTTPFVLLVPIFLLLKNNIFKVVFIFSTVGIFLITFIFNVDLIGIIQNSIPILKSFLPLENYSANSLSYTLSNNAIFMALSIYIFLVIYSFLLNNNFKNSDSIVDYNSLFRINCAALLFLPFLCKSLDFERYFRPILIINFSFLFIPVYLKDNRKWLIIICDTVFVALLFVRFIIHFGLFGF